MRRYLFGLYLACCFQPLQAATSLDKIAAIVDEDVVLESEVTQRIADLQFQYRNRPNVLPAEDILRTQVLEQLIVQHIQLSQAQRAGVRIDDNSLNASLTEIAQQNGMTLADFRTKLETEKAGSYNQIREQVRQEMMTSRVRNRRVGERVHITEQDIDNFLASPQGQTALETEYRLAHILISVPDEATPKQWAEAKSKAEQALALLLAQSGTTTYLVC